MQKRYEINTIATSLFGSNIIVEVKMKRSSRRFLLDENGLFIPLDGEPISKSMLGALCECASGDEFDKEWYLNAQHPITENDTAWAIKCVSKFEEWDWKNNISA